MLEILANMAELVGGLGTIVALIYLALQVRHSNRIAKAASRQTLFDTFHNRAWETGTDPELATLFAAGLMNWSSLSDLDKTRFTNMFNQFIANIENGIELHREGLVDEKTLQFIASAMAGCIQTPGGNDWWVSHKERNFISEAVIEYVEGLIENPGISIPPFSERLPYWAALANLGHNNDA